MTKKSNPSLRNKFGSAQPDGGAHIDIARRETGTKVRYDWKPQGNQGVREHLKGGTPFSDERSANDPWLKYFTPQTGKKR